MATTEEYLELAALAGEAIEEARRLQKSAALGKDDLSKMASVLTDCGLLQASEQEAFIKTASDNPKTLISAFEYIAKKANNNSMNSANGPVGFIVKSAEHECEVPDRDEPFVKLYSSRNKLI